MINPTTCLGLLLEIKSAFYCCFVIDFHASFVIEIILTIIVALRFGAALKYCAPNEIV